MYNKVVYNQDHEGYYLENYLEPSEDYDQTGELVEKKLDIDRLRGAISLLDKEQRAAIVMKFGLFDREYTQIEIARVLGVNQSTVKSLIQEGLERLFNILDPDQATLKARLSFMKMIEGLVDQKETPRPQ